jgi:hypothetical protein
MAARKSTKRPKARSRARRKRRANPRSLVAALDQLGVISSAASACVDAAAYVEHDDLAVTMLHSVALPLRAVLRQLKAACDEHGRS